MNTTTDQMSAGLSDDDFGPSFAPPSDDAVRKAKLHMIAGKVSELRRDRGWSQAELARRAGLNRNVVNTIENETSFPTRENLQRVAQALSTPLRALTDVYVEEAMHKAPAALNITEAKGRPGMAWIQVSRIVRSSTALKIYQLISEDDADTTDRG